MGENNAQEHKANGAATATAGSEAGAAKVMLPAKLMPISTKATITTTTTTTAAQGETRSPGAVSATTSPISLKPSSPTIAQTYMQPLPPTIITTPPTLLAHRDDVVSTKGRGGALGKVSASSATATLHKKDSGTYMASSTTQNTAASNEGVNGVQANHTNGSTTGPTVASLRRASQPDAAGLMSPAGKVLSRPLSTSKLSSTPLTAPHILPNQRYAGFNLAALGQLSPTASTMTISRADVLAHTGSSGPSHNSYFGTVSGASGTRSFGESMVPGGGIHPEGLALPPGSKTMCGSDAISLLDMEDSDLVMIDSNGNSSNSGVTGAAVVGETIASASAIVSNHASGTQNYYGNHSGGGTLTSSASSALLEASATAGSSHHHPGASVASSHLSPRSSLPSLTSQAKKDAIQRAAMIAAIQQNGGAKILTAHRVGRRQDRPNRGIRFGEFHRICEIEYGFRQGKPLIANGRTLIHSTRVSRLDGDIKREEMLYLFSDVLVTGTEITTATSIATALSSAKGAPGAIVDVQATPIGDTAVENPYAGHLENQHISRLTQVQADVVEDDERPLLKLTAPQVSSLLLFKSTACRDSFLALLSETIVAHKHHLLFQSKYLADLKKFKRHSAFSFDTSFLKTWGIPGGLNLGSIRPAGGNGGGGGGHGAIGPGTFTASPVTSPGGGAFDPYQYQQHLNRPQSMAGSLFNFALNGGGAFSSFTSSADQHSKESSYATLRGANAAQALQYHHHHQQMLQQQLQNRLSMSSTASISGAKASDRNSSGSAFDALWFIKGGETFRQPRRTAAEAVSALSQEDEEMTNEGELSGNVPTAGSAASSIHSSSSATNLPSVSNNPSSGQSSNRFSSSSLSLLPSSTSSSHQNIGTLRNGAGWVRDEDASVCMVCSTTKFGVLVRKHHCRLCGRVICWKCCQMKDAVVLNTTHDPTDAAPPAQEQPLRRPIRVCLDCIEQDASQDNAPQQQPNSPQASSFPLQGVFGKLMSSTVSSPHLVTSPTNATGSTFTTSPPHAQNHSHIPFPLSQPSTLYPRGMSYTRGGSAYPHHHRASLYRIDVERVGEEDEEDEEEAETGPRDVKSAEGKGDNATPSFSESVSDSAEGRKTDALHQEHSMDVPDSPPSSTSSLSKIIKSNHGTLRLKDLDPADINEDEINSQIMTLESEVESLLIQNAAAVAASPLLFTGPNGSSRSNVSAGRTRVMRGVPKELLQAGALFGNEEHEGDEEEEEQTVEELLAQQENLHRMLS
ncbi:hypothetical protein BGZ70_007883 [Mortierella alpina]|uniref:FYVE-type domain-containing protein n=1 Tax=Mortierella alpina TaxID=64518 RepID=A0A9P6J813_MORAP|nr:hypothetical protein BGZ70_007883 [Mortierella alpina]